MSDNTFRAVCVIAFFTFLTILTISEGSPGKLAERPCPIDHHEYQLNLDWRTIEIYKNGKFIGCYESDPDSTCPLDTILGNYNR